MDFSETIIAAMIGAGATVATATFQLFAAFRSRKADLKPKRSSGFRSALAVCGLVLGAAVAGFAYSELRMEREREDSRAMEQRISARLQALADGQLAQQRSGGTDDGALLAAAGVSPALHSQAMVRLAACRSQARDYGADPAGCDVADANRAAVCASVPARANVLDVRLFARVVGASGEWEQSRVAIDQVVDGARFVASTFEVQQASGQKAVCADFLQWNSERGHEARIVVVYAIGAASGAAKEEPITASAAGDVGFPAQAPDTEAVAAVPRHSLTSEIVPPDGAAQAAQSVIDPAPRAAQSAIAPQP